LGIGVNRDFHSNLSRPVRMHVIEVEAVRLGIQSMATSFSFAASKIASRSIANGSRWLMSRPVGWARISTGRMGEGLQDAPGHLTFGHIHFRVDGSDDDIELLEKKVGQIERSVGENVDLASQKRDAANALSNLLDFFALPFEITRAQTAGHPYGLAVTRDDAIGTRALCTRAPSLRS
jgi:hypothetical protein